MIAMLYAPRAELNCAGQLHFSWRLTHEIIDSDAHQKSHTLIVIDDVQASDSDGASCCKEMPEGRSLFVFFFAFFGIHHDETWSFENARLSRLEPARKA